MRLRAFTVCVLASVRLAVSRAALQTYSANLLELSSSGVSGEITIFISADGLLGVGVATGLEASLAAAPSGVDCVATNGCGVHVHSGIACNSATEQGSHFYSTGSDPWENIRYSSTDSQGKASFTFSVNVGTPSIGGKPFIVHNNAGERVACGILREVANAKAATLTPLAGSGVTGVITIFATAERMFGAGLADGLEANLMDSSNGGTNCTATNGCGVHIHSGSSCFDSVGQGGHLLTHSGTDPWTSVKYIGTSSLGSASFVFVVESDNTNIIGKPFIVHNNAGGRVSCGLLSYAFPTYVANIAELGSSGVEGEVIIFDTPKGLLGAGSAMGLEVNLTAAPSGTSCLAKNGCGVHVHSGTACNSSTLQGGHFYNPVQEPVDPWANVSYSSTDAQGVASFAFSVDAGGVAIEGKPFIVHNNAGTRVACGLLYRVHSTESTGLSELGVSGVSGQVTIYATASKIFGAGMASGLQANLDDSSNCTATNGCGVHVHSGFGCESAAQGGHLLTNSGTDPWTEVRYGSTTVAGFSTFVFAVPSDATDISGKPFIVHNNEGGRVACGLIPPAKPTALPIVYSASLVGLGGSGVGGEVLVFATSTSLLGAGSVTGLEASLIAAPSGSDCIANNGCGVHIHSGTGCATTAEQGGHFFLSSSDPWTNISYSSTDAKGTASFKFSVDVGTIAIGGKPFVVHNNAGARVACGILREVGDTKTATLLPLNKGGTTGVVTIYTTQSRIYGAGVVDSLEANLVDSSNGGTDCTATNGCGVHVHSGYDCSYTGGQGGHLLTNAGADPWTSIRYSHTTAIGSANFVFVVESDNTDVIGKPFVVHNNAGGRVSCGLLSPTFSTYVASITAIDSSGVEGEVSVFVTPTGLLGGGSVTGLEASLAAAPSGSDCTATNGCGVHVHSGTACRSAMEQGGHFYSTGEDPWTNIRYSTTNAQGAAAFTFSVDIGTTAIEGKPFIVHNNAGARVACGMLSQVHATKSTTLSELSTSGVSGKVTIYSTASKMFGAGILSGLEANLDASKNCTASNGCGVHVHSGSGCNSATAPGAEIAQGGHLLTMAGDDPWTNIRYPSTTPTGSATFAFVVHSDAVMASGKPFIVHNNAGGRVACGLLPPTTSTTTALPIAYTARLVELGGSGVGGEISIFATKSGLLGAGIATGLEASLSAVPSGSDCVATNGCGVHVHSGTACGSTIEQGGHFYATASDPWANVRYSITDAQGKASFTFSVDVGSIALAGKPFVVHNNAGVRVACGILKEVADTKTAMLSSLSDSGVTGAITVYTTSSKIFGAGFAGGLEANLADISNGGLSCIATNGCGVHVHSGSGCSDSAAQGGHLMTKSGDADPWTSIRYSSTTASGSTSFVFVVESDNTDVIGKPFIVHNNAGGRVSCGLLTPAFPTFVATMSEFASSGVTGEVTLFVTPIGLLGSGIVMGLESSLSAAPGGSDCIATNGCGVHVHSGTACGSTLEQGGHFYTTDTDPWTNIRYSSTDAQGMTSFTFSVDVGTTFVGGKPFVVHNNAGGRVACGVLSQQNGTKATVLSELSTSGVNGKMTIYSTASKIFGAGMVSGLETNLEASKNCTASNGCGVHVHSGYACSSVNAQSAMVAQGGHLLTTAGYDPWTDIRYGYTTPMGFSAFTFVVQSNNTEVTGKPFIVHNNAGGRVSCGLLPSTTTTTTAVPMVYTASLLQLDGSGVSGEVTIFVTSMGVLGAGDVIGLESSLTAAPSGSDCVATNGCGVHVHSGTACGSTVEQGGHFHKTDSDPWANIRYSSTDAQGKASFIFSADIGTTAVAGKAFIVHNNAGGRVACGILKEVASAKTASLSPFNGGSTTGLVTIYTTSSKIYGAGFAQGLETNLADFSYGGTSCTATNGCGVHIHSGDNCRDTDGQGGHLLTNSGTDPWTSVRYHSTTSSGSTSFAFVVDSDNTDVSGKPFVVHNNAGGRVSCGVLSPEFPTYVASMTELGGSGVGGDVTLFVTPSGLLGAGSVTGLEANLTAAPSGSDCMAANGCGVHVHSGIACGSTDEQGGHFYNTASDPWANIRYSSTDTQGKTSFTFSVDVGTAFIGGKAFVVHNNAGGRVACGILSLVQATKTTVLSELATSGATGKVTIYTTPSKVFGAGTVSGLEADLVAGNNCTATNGCGIHVHSGTSCSSALLQGGHLYTAGDDPWTTVKYESTTPSGFASFSFVVHDDVGDVSGKPFIVHNNAGDRVSCGLLPHGEASTTTEIADTSPVMSTTKSEAAAVPIVISGSLKFIAAAIRKADAIIASRAALAMDFNVQNTDVSVKALETRRLHKDMHARQLAGTWIITFDILVGSAGAAAAEAKMQELKADPAGLSQTLKAELVRLSAVSQSTTILISDFYAESIPEADFTTRGSFFSDRDATVNIATSQCSLCLLVHSLLILFASMAAGFRQC